jgi:hypothetical protein
MHGPHCATSTIRAVSAKIAIEDKLMLKRDDVLQEALALPPADRAFVVVALEKSLIGEDDALADANGKIVSGTDLLQELRRRSASYRAGQSRARPAAEVLADIRQRLANETIA